MTLPAFSKSPIKMQTERTNGMRYAIQNLSGAVRRCKKDPLFFFTCSSIIARHLLVAKGSFCFPSSELCARICRRDAITNHLLSLKKSETLLP